MSAFPDGQHAIKVEIEKPLYFKERQPLVVCVGPMYIYTEWQILITGIETWLAMGATKFIVPIGSASKDTYRILKEYEAKGLKDQQKKTNLKINFRNCDFEKLANVASIIGYQPQWFSFIQRN